MCEKILNTADSSIQPACSRLTAMRVNSIEKTFMGLKSFRQIVEVGSVLVAPIKILLTTFQFYFCLYYVLIII